MYLMYSALERRDTPEYVFRILSGYIRIQNVVCIQRLHVKIHRNLDTQHDVFYRGRMLTTSDDDIVF